ncbi:MAG: B12-binding domain-containing radical SAM protein [Acidobacteria bacterium]|nr:B12-binding domain-containing radical SAM protein [Acidobacteriota bacterium]MBU4352910.1 B12-binding domain-containing radical SAM protein [Nanoarchaeota archaeon]
MKILLVYPQYPDTFWGFKHALKFIFKKAAFPPLGLLTVASMLPLKWERRLVDLNVSNLNDREILWADYVFLSAMAVQRESAKTIIARCSSLGVKIVAGGPLFTTEYEAFPAIDHFVLNEAEITLPQFLRDLEMNCARRIYTSDQWPDLSLTPLPQWNLIKPNLYNSMAIQYSRGCPFDCEFCDIVVLNGRTPRTKSREQMIAELNALKNRHRKGSVFIVDDNFIGNKNKLKSEILPAIAQWMQQNKHPFSLFTEASINLADDDALIDLMVKANFKVVFIGIETPNAESLTECGKYQNKNRDLVASVQKLQNAGLQVQGGFIVGFDNDPLSIFENQIKFIQNSGIVTAMVGLLHAPPGTKLYKRLKTENRIKREFSGNNTDFSTNFVPKMQMQNLLEGYHNIISTIYAPRQYCERVITFLKNYHPVNFSGFRLQFAELCAFIKSIFVIGLNPKGKRYYWKLMLWTLFKKPRLFHMSVTLAIYGFHFRKIVEQYSKLLVSKSA